MDSGTVIGVVSTSVGIVAAGFSIFAARRSQRIAAGQQKIAAHSVVAAWSRDLRGWAAQCIEVLAEASYTCRHSDDSGDDCASELRKCRQRLSALIDQGRFFLPNIPAVGVGANKPSAYRGWRHAALDPLVAAERVLSGDVGSGKYATREAAITEMRRYFVSAIQDILGPESNNKEIARMIRDGNEQRAKDPTLGGLLPDGSVAPPGADRLLFESSDKNAVPKSS